MRAKRCSGCRPTVERVFHPDQDETRIVALLRRELPKRQQTELLRADMTLRELKMDSLKILTFAMAVETEFGVDGDLLERRLCYALTLGDLVRACRLLIADVSSRG